ncbi:MAG: response regulator [Rhizonema sp. PD38]|nr:response regulator [Rhizonema sp. PD38]
MSGLKFLLLEDSLLDAELIHIMLTESGIECELLHIKTGTEFQREIEQGGFDLILSDYSLPGFDGFAALKMAQQKCPDIPFIFVSATMGEEVAIETMKSGATDYVLKQRLERLVPSVRRALREAEERRARQQVQAELHRREQEFRALVENSPDIIARVDRDFRHVYVNPAIEKATGIPAENIIGKTHAELEFQKEFYTSWNESMQQVLKTGVGCCFEFSFPAADGIRYYQSQIVPEFDLDGSIQSLLSISRDLTDNKQAEQLIRASEAELRQQKEELEHANRVKDEFLAVLSHELRSPLNAILGWSKILRTRKLDVTTFARALETIERNAHLQTQLIEDLLDVSRIIRGKLILRSQPTSLVPAIEAAIDTMRLAAEAKSINLQFTIFEQAEKSVQLPPFQNSEEMKSSLCRMMSNESDSESPPEMEALCISDGEKFTLGKAPNSKPKFIVLGDPNRLQQIIWNLLSNAIKFTSTKGQVEVYLELVKEDPKTRGHGDTGNEESLSANQRGVSHYAQITVKDTGIGISRDFLPYVFDSFRQEDASMSRKHGGLGLGLAIVRHLVELHGGTVTASSSGEGKGSIFRVQLPLLLESRLGGVESKKKSPDSLFSTRDSRLAGVRVLVVDDDADSRDFLVFALKDSGAIATAANSTSSALDVLVSFKPHVLISDIGMPREDGYTLIRQVRTLSPAQGGQIPAIAVTAYAGDRDRHEAISAGFQRHVSKPVIPDALVNMIVELVGC